MTEIAFTRGDDVLVGHDVGRGEPLLFQHGLGGSAAQVAAHLPAIPGIRRLTLECRAHGASPPGASRPFRIGDFASDALAFCDLRDVDRFMAGGISMGAAIALRLAVRHPGRVTAVILVRPAWLFADAPATLSPYVEVARLMRSHAPDEAKALFEASETATRLGRDAPDNLASLLGFFGRPDVDVAADLLEGIATDGPGVTRDEVAALDVPALVLGHDVDDTHPFAYARELADLIPGARLVRIPPKSHAAQAHHAAVGMAVGRFLASIGGEPAP